MRHIIGCLYDVDQKLYFYIHVIFIIEYFQKHIIYTHR